MGRERRRNYFIDKKFQAEFIVKFCLLVALGAVLSGAIIFFSSRSTLTTSFVNLRLVVQSTADYILPAVLLSGAVCIGLVGLASAAVTLFTSHRIAGPLYRIQKDVDAIRGGDLRARIHLRQSDEIKALASSINAMADTLRKDVDSLTAVTIELERKCRDKETAERIHELRAILKKYSV